MNNNKKQDTHPYLVFIINLQTYNFKLLNNSIILDDIQFIISNTKKIHSDKKSNENMQRNFINFSVFKALHSDNSSVIFG